MLNEMLSVPRRRRIATTVAAGDTVNVDLGQWDRVEGRLAMVATRGTIPAGSVGVNLTMRVGGDSPGEDFALSVERSVGGGPQIEDPVYKAAGIQGNRIQIKLQNLDGANPVVVTTDTEVVNRF